MKNKIIFSALAFLAVFFSFRVALADTVVHLHVTAHGSTIYNQDMSVAPCDSDNAGGVAITAYCAIKQTGLQNSWDWSWPPGAFLISLANIAGYTSKDGTGNDVYHYWSWYLNGTEGTTALNEYVLASNDIIRLDFIDPGYSGSSSVGSGPLVTDMPGKDFIPASNLRPSFDVKKGLDFLAGSQKADGSFGEDLYTDWATVALVSGNYQTQTAKLAKYLAVSDLSKPSLTDYERRTMALMALGLDPYDTNGKNYIKKITDQFDGKQFGDAGKDNDDIFALIVLSNAGFTRKDEMMEKDIAFILGRQKTDGSWDESPDMTGAAMEALSAFNPDNKTIQNDFLSGQVQKSLIKAENFLRQSENGNGGWGDNASSTAWVLEGIMAMGEKPGDWMKNNNSPLDYLATVQDTDGSVKNSNMQNKIWETSYVVSALSGKTWNEIMGTFSRETISPAAETFFVPKRTAKADGGSVSKQAVQIQSPAENGATQQQNSYRKNWLARVLGFIFFGVF